MTDNINIAILIDKTFVRKVVCPDNTAIFSLSKLLDFAVKNIKQRVGKEFVNVSIIETFQGLNTEQSVADNSFNRELRESANYFNSTLRQNEYQTKTLSSGLKKEAGVDSAVYISVEDIQYNNTSLKHELQNSKTTTLSERGIIDYILLFSGDGDYMPIMDRIPSSIGFGLIAVNTTTAKTNQKLLDKFGTSESGWRTIINCPDKLEIAFNKLPIKSTISELKIGMDNNNVIDHTKSIIFLNIPDDVRLRENYTKSGLMIPLLSSKLPEKEVYKGKTCYYDVAYTLLHKQGKKVFEFVATNLSLM